MTTNEYIKSVKQKGWREFHWKLWQRSYWDRIIRDEKAHQTIAGYIIENPMKWHLDDLYTQ